MLRTMPRSDHSTDAQSSEVRAMRGNRPHDPECGTSEKITRNSRPIAVDGRGASKYHSQLRNTEAPPQGAGQRG
jgi:hypothetical protein